MALEEFCLLRDRLTRELDEETGLSIMPVTIGAVIGFMFQTVSDSEAHEKIVADVNQSLERTGAQYRLRAID